jgi:hypothetical protein
MLTNGVNRGKVEEPLFKGGTALIFDGDKVKLNDSIKTYWGVEVQLHAFLTCALDGCE